MQASSREVACSLSLRLPLAWHPVPLPPTYALVITVPTPCFFFSLLIKFCVGAQILSVVSSFPVQSCSRVVGHQYFWFQFHSKFYLSVCACRRSLALVLRSASRCLLQLLSVCPCSSFSLFTVCSVCVCAGVCVLCACVSVDGCFSAASIGVA